VLELLVVVAATTSLFALAKGIRGSHPYRIDPSLIASHRDDRGDDLPCPWCYAPTQEQDSRCKGCGRSFG
jgi:hypothetical protein